MAYCHWNLAKQPTCTHVTIQSDTFFIYLGSGHLTYLSSSQFTIGLILFSLSQCLQQEQSLVLLSSILPWQYGPDQSINQSIFVYLTSHGVRPAEGVSILTPESWVTVCGSWIYDTRPLCAISASCWSLTCPWGAMFRGRPAASSRCLLWQYGRVSALYKLSYLLLIIAAHRLACFTLLALLSCLMASQSINCAAETIMHLSIYRAPF